VVLAVFVWVKLLVQVVVLPVVRPGLAGCLTPKKMLLTTEDTEIVELIQSVIIRSPSATFQDKLAEFILSGSERLTLVMTFLLCPAISMV